MLFHLLLKLKDLVSWLSWLNVVRYTSTRIIAATMTALLMSFLLSPWFIRRLQEQQFALVIPTLLWCDLRNGFVWLVLLVTVGYGVIGFVDDYLKLVHKNPKGLPGRAKMTAQVVIGLLAVVILFC